MMKDIRINYANDAQFASVLEKYGGEAFLREKFPRILQMLHDTREWHNAIQDEMQEEEQKQKQEQEQAEVVGYGDTFRISEIPVYPVSKDGSVDTANPAGSKLPVFADSLMSLVEQKPFLHMSSTVNDPKNGKAFGGFSVFSENANNLQDHILVDHSYLTYCDEPHVQVATDFMAVAKVNGKDVCVSNKTDVRAIDISGMGTPVKKVTVNQPAPQKASDTYIRVVYNGRTDHDAAYNFSCAKDRYIDPTRYVTVFYPFSVHVELSDGFVFVPNSPVTFDYTLNISMASNVISGGEIHFSTAKWSKIVASASGNTLDFDFKYIPDTDFNYWSAEMPLTSAQAEGYFDFHLNFTIKYRHSGIPGQDLATTIIVTSADLPASPNLYSIKKSRILWGCLGKNTIIRTEGGSKKIDKLVIGEKLFTDNGYVALKNMVTGIEEKIIAVGVDEDKTLLITKAHPIATDRGVIRADCLVPGDQVKLEDGSYKKIYYLEVLDYDDQVFSPELEKPALISANGLMVGDYLTPVDVNVTEEVEKAPEPLDPELLEELKKWSEYKNALIQKEVHI